MKCTCFHFNSVGLDGCFYFLPLLSPLLFMNDTKYEEGTMPEILWFRFCEIEIPCDSLVTIWKMCLHFNVCGKNCHIIISNTRRHFDPSLLVYVLLFILLYTRFRLSALRALCAKTANSYQPNSIYSILKKLNLKTINVFIIWKIKQHFSFCDIWCVWCFSWVP